MLGSVPTFLLPGSLLPCQSEVACNETATLCSSDGVQGKKMLSQLFTDLLGHLQIIRCMCGWADSDFICFSKSLTALKLLTNAAVYMALLCPVGGAVTCLQRLVSNALLHISTRQLHGPDPAGSLEHTHSTYAQECMSQDVDGGGVSVENRNHVKVSFILFILWNVI